MSRSLGILALAALISGSFVVACTIAGSSTKSENESLGSGCGVDGGTIAGGVLLLHLDEAAGATSFVDSSGSGNAASCGATGCPAAGVPGAIGHAVRFDGATASLRVPGAPSLKPAGAVAAGAFVQKTTLPSATGQLTGEEVLSMGDSYVLEVRPDGNVRFFIYDGTNWDVADTKGVNVVDGSFHHVLGQKTATALEVYVDGTLRGSAAFSGTIAYTLGADLAIGKHGNVAGRYFNGVIDEAVVFGRALTAQEIAQLAGTGACIPKTCAAQGANCGSVSDGCGGMLSCGTCTAPQTCGGGGKANVCGGGGSVSVAGMLDDGLSHPPPAGGAFAYNGFVPAQAPGTSYVDPVFRATVRRLTNDHDADDIYARNMWWSADEKRYLHRTKNGGQFADFWNVIDATTGQITHKGIPIGGLAADSGFDPVDANVLYSVSGASIHKITLGAGGTWTDAVYFTAPGGATIGSLGGTQNWLDASGRYMVVRYGPEPSVHLYDRQNLAAGPYAGAVDGASTIDVGSYVGITPDGKFLIGYASGGLGMGQGVSWRIDHASRTVSATRNVFWDLCGDHGAFSSASDGRDYMIVTACNNSPGVWRVDITNNAAGMSEAQQLALPNNRIMLKTGWSDAVHFSTVARGPLQDWAFVSTEDGSDTFNSGSADANGLITPWRVYRQEIVAMNLVTGEVRRLAHHRSRSVFADYYNTPRLSASWGGAFVGYASDFDQNGLIDIFAIPFAQ